MHGVYAKEQCSNGCSYGPARKQADQPVYQRCAHQVKEEAVEMIEPWLQAHVAVLYAIAQDSERVIVTHHGITQRKNIFYPVSSNIFYQRIIDHIARIVPVCK